MRERSQDIVEELATFHAGSVDSLRRLVLRSQAWLAAGDGDRRGMDDERNSLTHHFVIHAGDGDYQGYMTVGMYPDGRPGELFLRMEGPQIGHMIAGWADSFSIAVSMALQCGCELATLCTKYIGQRYEPSGHTDTPSIPRTTAPVDYIFRWLKRKFIPDPPSIPLPGVPTEQ